MQKGTTLKYMFITIKTVLFRNTGVPEVKMLLWTKNPTSDAFRYFSFRML